VFFFPAYFCAVEILRFITAGSVDDGKSTLIGRLLYETGNIPKDEFETVKGKYRTANGNVDFSRFTDGLADERAKGITIDVAYRYFFTANRKYIIADSPGHKEYTRNMFTAASNADAAIVLVDANHGVTEQTFRHSQVLALLKVPNVAYAVNKMDAFSYNQERFQTIKASLEKLAQRLGICVQTVPVSALEGENLIMASPKMPWYTGPSLLAFLENSHPKVNQDENSVVMVQYVTRENKTLHALGKLLNGEILPKEMVVLPSQKRVFIQGVWEEGIRVKDEARGQNVSFELADDIPLERGDIVVKNPADFIVSCDLLVKCCHFSEVELQVGKPFILKIGTQERVCRVKTLLEKLDPTTGQINSNPSSVSMNDFAWLALETDRAVVYANRNCEELMQGILIDMQTNFTASAILIDSNGF
jgi:sulfate adenylyltransferase large subunit